jgi:hypothetical protein
MTITAIMALLVMSMVILLARRIRLEPALQQILPTTRHLWNRKMRQVQVLSQTLQEISARAKTFGKCGALMAEATRRLALACRLKPSSPSSSAAGGGGGPDDDDAKPNATSDTQDKILKERQDAVGEEMMMVLSTLGEVRTRK